MFYADSKNPDQTPLSVASNWVCTVCPCLFNGRLGIGWLICIYIYIVELQWLEHLWNHENMFETGEVRANEC